MSRLKKQDSMGLYGWYLLVRWAAQAFIFTASIARFAALVACIAISLGAKETLAALGVRHAACGVVQPVARYTRLAAGQGEALQARCPAAVPRITKMSPSQH